MFFLSCTPGFFVRLAVQMTKGEKCIPIFEKVFTHVSVHLRAQMTAHGPLFYTGAVHWVEIGSKWRGSTLTVLRTVPMIFWNFMFGCSGLCSPHSADDGIRSPQETDPCAIREEVSSLLGLRDTSPCCKARQWFSEYLFPFAALVVDDSFLLLCTCWYVPSDSFLPCPIIMLNTPQMVMSKHFLPCVGSIVVPCSLICTPMFPLLQPMTKHLKGN